MGVGNHGGLNFEREREGVATLACGDQRLAPSADRFEERLNLKAQRFARSDRRFEERQARDWDWLRGPRLRQGWLRQVAP